MKFATDHKLSNLTCKKSQIELFRVSWSAEMLFHHAEVLKLQVSFLLKTWHKLEIHSGDININESTLMMANIEQIRYW